MKLITIKEYAKQAAISEQGARKRVASKLVDSCQLSGSLYVVVSDNSDQVIKDLKSKARLLNSKIKTLKAENITVVDQAEEIKYLRGRIITLEEDLRTAAERLNASTSKKEDLYEKVINTLIPRNTGD